MRLLKNVRLDSITKDTPWIKIVKFVEYMNFSPAPNTGWAISKAADHRWPPAPSILAKNWVGNFQLRPC